MSSVNQESKIVCDEAEVIKIVRSTMLPEIFKLQSSIDSLAKDVQHVTIDMKKDDDALKAELLEVKAELSVLKGLLYGNGQPGLKGRIDSMQEWVESRKSFEKLIVGAIVVQLIGFVVIIGQHVLSTP